MTRVAHVIILALVFLLAQGSSLAHSASHKSGETIKGIQAEGACAIVGMSAEQSQLAALQRARAAAIFPSSHDPKLSLLSWGPRKKT